MPASLRKFVDKAMAYCWDESHGYSQSQDGMGHPGFDCSGLVGRCLYEAGFDYPSTHVGTMYMKARLAVAGFQILYPSSLQNVIDTIKPGDIVVMNHLNWTGGHTFIYMEDVYGYTSTLSGYSTNYPNTKGNCSKARIEAADVRSWNVSLADDPNPNTGACTEVFVHNFDWNYAFSGYSFTSSGDEIYIAHWPHGLDDDRLFLLKRIRDGQFNFDSWANKYNDNGL